MRSGSSNSTSMASSQALVTAGGCEVLNKTVLLYALNSRLKRQNQRRNRLAHQLSLLSVPT